MGDGVLEDKDTIKREQFQIYWTERNWDKLRYFIFRERKIVGGHTSCGNFTN